MDEVVTESHRVGVNGVELRVLSAGPADGPLVVFLHGFPEMAGAWRGQIAYFARAGYRVLAPDQRGYGASDKPAGLAAYRVSELALDVRELVRWSGREKAHVVGHDWGGCVAWWTAILHAECVQSLNVVNFPHPEVMRANLRGNFAQLSRSWYAMFFQLPWLPEWGLGLAGNLILKRVLRESSRPGTFTDEKLGEYEAAWAGRGALSAMINWYRAALHYPAPPVTDPILAPTLLIWGEEDTFLGREMAEPSRALCREGTLERLAEGTHWVHHEQPARVNALLQAHFSRFSQKLRKPSL